LPAFKEGFVEVWGNADHGVWRDILDTFKGMWETIKGVFKDILGTSFLTAAGFEGSWKETGKKVAEFIGTAFEVIGKIFKKVLGLFGDFKPLVGDLGGTIQGFFGPGAADRMFGAFGTFFTKHVLMPAAKFLDMMIGSEKIAGVVAEQFGFEGGIAGGKKLRAAFGLQKETDRMEGKILKMQEEFDEATRRAKITAVRAGLDVPADRGGGAGGITTPDERAVADAAMARSVTTTRTQAPPTTQSGGQQESDTIIQINIDRQKFFEIVVEPSIKQKYELTAG